MGKYPGSVTGITVRSGLSYARMTTIDGYLGDAEIELLYKNWKPTWPEPNEFRGGIKAITCEMVVEVPEQEFLAAFGKRGSKTREMGAHILEVAKRNAER